MASYDSAAPALALDPFAAGDIRPVWERNRWAELPLLAQAARLDPGGGPRWRARKRCWPIGAARTRPSAARTGCAARKRRCAPCISASPWRCWAGRGRRRRRARGSCWRSTPAASPPRRPMPRRRTTTTPFRRRPGCSSAACCWATRAAAAQGAARLSARVRRLVAPCGAFAQLSAGYHRLLLDVLSVTEWLCRRRGGPGLDGEARARAAAAVAWLHRVVDPATGAAPRLGHEDGSAFADLSLAGPADARPSLERAARLLAGRSAGFADDPGCAWLDLPPCPPLPAPPSEWEGEGLRGWTGEGGARALLRTGPLRFRPGHADLLHLDLWDGALNLLRDGGTGAYNPPPDRGVVARAPHRHRRAQHGGVRRRGPDAARGALPVRAVAGNRAAARMGRGCATAAATATPVRCGARAARGWWRIACRAASPGSRCAGAWRRGRGARPRRALKGRWRGSAWRRMRLSSARWNRAGKARPMARCARSPVLVARAAAPVSRLLTRIELPRRGA